MNLVFESLSLNFQMLKFPKSAWERHFWLAELASLKMASQHIFSSDRLQFPGHFGARS